MKWDNLSRLSPPIVIFAGDFRGAGNAPKEGAWPHGALDLKFPEIIREIKEAVLELDAGNIFADIDRFACGFLGNTHALPSRSPCKPEQSDIRVNPENKYNTLNAVIDGLSTALRRTTKPFRRFSAETVRGAAR